MTRQLRCRCTHGEVARRPEESLTGAAVWARTRLTGGEQGCARGGTFGWRVPGAGLPGLNDSRRQGVTMGVFDGS